MSIRLGKRFRSLLATGALTAGLLGGAIAVAPSAAAWTYLGHCSGGQTISYTATSTQLIKVPVIRYDGLNNVRCWMDYGSTGNGVEVLQLALKSCYGRSIAVDGVFGSATRDALKYAQRQEGITVDGQYGEQGFRNLKWARYTQDGTRNGCASYSF
ncbi:MULTISPECIES: peptidoglycan-binding domain-containing protein [unclassified Streptomyces]|uniref:peptidoglycan-binding domain-containing protein n=1 Tax=unclassified Streptomyces TaxID=2593676 RepID=UPI00163D43D5|nr:MULTISPECIES: peptidoglycan-binding domain-containing protein [unclassified Streptomyces]